MRHRHHPHHPWHHQPRWGHRGRRPLLLKLFGIFFLTGLLVVAIIGGMFALNFRGHRERFEIVAKNADEYTSHLIERIGSPPDPERAAALARKLKLRVRIEGAGLDWASAPEVPKIRELRAATHHTRGELGLGRARGDFFLIVDRAGYAYAFLLWEEADPTLGIPFRKIVGLMAFILLVLAMSFISVRLLLRPLRRLMTGVAAVAAGDLNHKVETGSGDEFDRVSSAFNDMTARVRDMIRSKEQLLLDVSHELRSPLTRMKLALEMLPEGAGRDQLGSDIRELEAMVSELLETARLESPNGSLERLPFELAPWLDELITRYRATGARVELAGEAPRVTIEGDPVRLRRALANVVDNAIKHSPESSAPVRIEARLADDRVEIDVRDHGPGIPESERERIFEPFYRTDRSRVRETGGYGLGLSLVRKILRAHGGEAEIVSVSPGVIFRLKIPLK